MKPWGYRLFVAGMLLVMALPAAGLLRADPPGVGEALDAYVEENIAFREVLIEVNAAVSGALFGQSGHEQVVRGKEGWLYFAETLPDYLARAPMADADVARLAGAVAGAAEALRAQGIGFTFLCAPNKATVYPAYMPYYLRPAGGEDNLTRLQAALAARGVDVLDAKALLVAHREDGLALYHRTDTHWNARGARLVYAALMARFDVAYDDYAAAPWKKTMVAAGDLARMAYPLSAKGMLDMSPDIQRAYQTVGVMRSLDDMIIQTRSDANGLSLVVFRDSFGEALFPYLANNAGALTYARTPFFEGVAEVTGADHVVLEVAERNLPGLLAQIPPAY